MEAFLSRGRVGNKCRLDPGSLFSQIYGFPRWMHGCRKRVFSVYSGVGPVHNKTEIREPEREPAVTQVALFRHMCIMDRFHSTAVAFAHEEREGETERARERTNGHGC